MDREIRQYLGLVKRWWWLLLVSAVIPMAISYYFASRQPDLYQAKATILVGASVLQNPDPDRLQMDLSSTLAAAYAELIRQGPILEAVIERLGLERTPERLAAQIVTSIRSRAQLLEIEVTDTSPEAAALIANALADELIQRSPASGSRDPGQQEFVRSQLEELQTKIGRVDAQIAELTASLAELTSAAEIQDAQERIAALEEVKSLYQSTYASLVNVYQAESPNVLSLFEPASVPQWPVPSKTKLIVAVAGVAGLGLALGAVTLMEYLDTSLRWERGGEQFILSVPVLGAVPRVSRKQALLASSLPSPALEGARTVWANAFLRCPDRSFKTLLLTSPTALDGKSFVLASLGVALASAGSRVIMVDADMRSPSLHELFDQDNVTGLADVLSNREMDDQDSFPIPLQESGFENLSLLSAGRPSGDLTSLLTSTRFPALLEFLGEQGDVVLIDSPPVLGFPDATVVATLVEGTILVMSVGSTTYESLQQAKDRLLANQRVELLGLVVNRIKPRGGDYSYAVGRERRPKRERRDGNGSWLTLGEAAERLGIGKDQARRWCRSGRLPAVRRWLQWRVAPDELQRMLDEAWEIKTKAKA